MTSDTAIKLARENYLSYVEFVHRGFWKAYPFHERLGEIVDDILNGAYVNEDGYTQIILSCPPQHGKSNEITETLPSYFVGKNPDKDAMIISYGDELSRKFGERNLSKAKEFWPIIFDKRVSKTTRAKTAFEVEGYRGSIRSFGLKGSITGKGADLMIIDDPIKNDAEANSPTYREMLWSLYDGTFKTRIHKGAILIVIMTRWHEDDLVGRLLKNEPGRWTLINFEACCTDPEKDPMRRKVGQMLCPELGYDKQWMKSKQLSPRAKRVFQAMCQGNPTPQDGTIFKRATFKYWEPTKLPDEWDSLIWSIDASFKGEAKHDFVVLQRWGLLGKFKYLLNQYRKQLSFTETIDLIRAEIPKEGWYAAFFIEDAANGPAIISVMEKELPNVIAVSPKELGTKIGRANACEISFSEGEVFLPPPELYAWVDNEDQDSYIMELIKFPYGRNDDQVDATTLAIIKLNEIAIRNKFCC